MSDLITKQWNELLSSTEEYKQGYPDNLAIAIPQIADNFLLYAGYDIANIGRGIHGPSYHSAACTAAKIVKAPFNKNDSCEVIEQCILNKVVEKWAEGMSEEELKKLLDEMEIHCYGGFKKQAMIAALLYAFRAGGFTSYKILVIVVNYVLKAILGRGLTFAANAALTRITSLCLGPAAATLMVLLAIKDLTAPAARVVVPGVILIAFMRMEQKLLPDNRPAA